MCTGSLHGVHTFSALLAVYARVCGVEHMMQLGTWILALSVFLLWLVLENLGIKTLYKAIALFLYVLSPQVLWQAKTSLVETTLAFVILAMLYLLTDKKHEEYRWLFCIPVVVFAFLHITIYVFMPLFVLMAYGLYFKTGRKSYIAGAVVMLAGYLAGFFMMYASSLTYVYGNYDRLYIGPVGPSNLKAFVTAVSVAGIVFSLVLGLLPVKKNTKAVSGNAQSMRKEQNRFKNACWRIFVWVFAAAGLAACLLVMKKSAYPSAYMTSYAYLLSSGIILMPVIFIAAFLRPSWFKKKDSIVLLTAMFYYCVIIYSAVFKKEILHYYYYGRYIVPYIAVIVVLGAYILSRTAESMAHIRILRDGYGMLCAAAALAVAAVLIPYAGIVVHGLFRPSAPTAAPRPFRRPLSGCFPLLPGAVSVGPSFGCRGSPPDLFAGSAPFGRRSLREQLPAAFDLAAVGRDAVLHARDGCRDGNHRLPVARVDRFVGVDPRVVRHGADIGFGAVLRRRSPARNHLPEAPQPVPPPVGVEQYENGPVAPCRRFELLELRVARRAHLALVAHARLPDVARVAVFQPPAHRPASFPMRRRA